jgi:hypothetical protein
LEALPHQAKGQPSTQLLRAVLSACAAELADGEEHMEESMDIEGSATPDLKECAA